MTAGSQFLRRQSKAMLGRLGFMVVRVDPTSGVHAGRDPDNGRFMPEGDNVRGGWPVPDDIARAFGTHWWDVLHELYQRPAAWPGSVSPENGLLLYALVRNIRPRTIIETGTCHGASTIWMSAALAASGGGIVHSFDRFELPDDSPFRGYPLYQQQERQVRNRITRAGLDDHVELHVGDSDAGIRRLRQRQPGLRSEIAYLDADHSFEGVRADFLAVEPAVPVGGYIILHDVFPDHCGCAGPRALIAEIDRISDHAYQICDLYTAPNNYGITVLRKLERR